MNDPFVLHHQATGQLLIYVTYKYMGKDVSVLSMLHCQKKKSRVLCFICVMIMKIKLTFTIHPSIHPSEELSSI